MLKSRPALHLIVRDFAGGRAGELSQKDPSLARALAVERMLTERGANGSRVRAEGDAHTVAGDAGSSSPDSPHLQIVILGAAPALAPGIAASASNPDSDVHAYTVLLDVHGAVQSVSIDDSSGEVIANPSTLTG